MSVLVLETCMDGEWHAHSERPQGRVCQRPYSLKGNGGGREQACSLSCHAKKIFNDRSGRQVHAMVVVELMVVHHKLRPSTP